MLFLLLTALPATNAEAAPWDSQRKVGEDNYQNNKYNEALKSFLEAQVKEPKDLELKYNTANSYYKMKDYEKAFRLFESTAKKGDKELSAKSFYNLGNTAYKMGKLKDSVEYYKKALELKPNDEDTKHNLSFVRKEIKEGLKRREKGRLIKKSKTAKRAKNQNAQQNPKGQKINRTTRSETSPKSNGGEGKGKT